MESESCLQNIKSVRRDQLPRLPTKHRFVFNPLEDATKKISKMEKDGSIKNKANKETINNSIPVASEKRKKSSMISHDPLHHNEAHLALDSIRSLSSYNGSRVLSMEDAEKNLYNLLNRRRNMIQTKGKRQNLKSLLETVLVLQSNDCHKLGNNSRW